MQSFSSETIDYDKEASDLMLQVCLDDETELVTQRTPVVWTPPWGLSLSLDGSRSYAHIFRLPNSGLWIRKWVYARGAETELVPENAIEHSTTESTSVFRVLPNFGQALPVVSNHWFLIPLHSFNGFTVGLAYLDVTLDRVDDMSVHPVECGRFAMDELTGEVFMTSWRPEGTMIVAWTQSISSCERVRELFLFEADNIDGMPPNRILLRNSFYERRNCRMCSRVAGSELVPPCSAPASRPRTQTGIAHDSLLPLHTMYRRFRGHYFGRCFKTRFYYSDRGATRMEATVPIMLDIRHGIASISRRLKLNWRQGAMSFGTDPRVSSRMLLVRSNRRISASPVDPESCGDLSGNVSSECSGSTERIPSEDDPQRRRNADGVLDRDSILHMRKVRNRESAARTNEARKRRITENRAELENLKSVKLPTLKSRKQELADENKRLKEMLSRSNARLDESIVGQNIIADNCLSGILEIPDDFFLDMSN